MPQLLIYDEAFVPCQVAEGDELFRNGIFVFNISKLINYLGGESSGIAVTEVDNYKLPCYRVDVTGHLHFLTSKNAYSAYVEYWNGYVRLSLQS